MDRIQAQHILRMLLLRRGSLAYTKHARERMAERKFTAPHIMRALSGGLMTGEPMQAANVKGFECVMRTKLDDGRTLEVPIVVDEDARRIIVKSAVRK